MNRLRLAGLCLAAVFALALAVTARASTTVPRWFECAKAAKSGRTYSGHYTGKLCEVATKVAGGGKYELKEGIGKGKQFRGKGRAAVLNVKTSLGDVAVECTSSKDSGTPALPNRETGVAVTYKGCRALGSKVCSSPGGRPGEIKIAGLKGELSLAESPSPLVSLKLESEAHPGPNGEIVSFRCAELEVAVTGKLSAMQGQDIDVISKEFETVDLAAEPYAGPGQRMVNKGEALMIKTGAQASEGPKVLLIGEAVPHERAGDSKTDEITPVKFTAQKSGTVEELFYETGGYTYFPAEKSLVLGIQEDVGGRPGKVLGEGTYSGTLGLNAVARVAGLKVPVMKGRTYFLDFLPLGGAVTYWYQKSETVIYSVNHKKLVEGPPEDYEWIEEAEAQPIGIWAKGT